MGSDEALLERFAKCPICLSVWDSEGPHRVVATECGHLYGKSCITDWIRRDPHNGCPQCHKSATIEDLRVIFPPVILVARNHEREVQPSPSLLYPIPLYLSEERRVLTAIAVDLMCNMYSARMSRDIAYTSYQCAQLTYRELSVFQARVKIGPFTNERYVENKRLAYLDAADAYNKAYALCEEAIGMLKRRN